MPTKPEISETDVYVSCGNIFADLGLPDPEIHLAKAELVRGMSQIMEKHGLTNARAAKRLRLDSSELKKIRCGQFLDYSLEQLLSFNNLLGQSVHFSFSQSHRNGTPPAKAASRRMQRKKAVA